MEKTDILDVQAIDELPVSQAWKVMLLLPVFVFFSNVVIDKFFGKYYHSWLPMSKGNRLTWIELTIVLVGFFIDDYCTSVGQQAEEVPRGMVEGNVFMGALMQWWIRNGYAKTETAAHRLTLIVFCSEILLMQYFGFYTVTSRVYMLATAAAKAYGGYGWCNQKPNNFTFSDWISFKDGRPTPERMSPQLLGQYNVQQGLVSTRRRAMAVPISGAEWYMRYLPYIFPTL